MKSSVIRKYPEILGDEVVAIDTFLGKSVQSLSVEFFEDVRNFNATFSRARLEDAEV